jgi:hypothetical protein
MPFRIRLLAIAISLVGQSVLAAEPSADQIDFVEKRIRPLLAENCIPCHGEKKQSNQLRLDSLALMLKGGDSGPALLPGKPYESLIIQAVRRQGDLKMPPKNGLSKQAMDDLVEWVRIGAPWPKNSRLVETNAKRHWSFQPIGSPPIPSVRQADWPQTAIDRFVLAKLESQGLAPSPPADRRALIRRVTFDLIGLPPTPQEVASFLNDHSPDAWSKVVDRLLSSPRYGERWGRFWLDVARFADTKGYVFFQDANFPWSYTYRDYVIQSLNKDLPYDRFVLEQIAADQLNLGEDKRGLTALGFLTLGGRFMNNVHDICDDRIDVVTRGLMGLTVTCARCHDHKFDPISQKDYYALYGVFASCTDPEVPPLFEEPPKTAVYEAFRKEIEVRERRLLDFIRTQYRATVAQARSRVAEYLMAVHNLGDQPAQDDFMLLTDGADLNPKIISRWRAQLNRAKRRHDPVLAPWNVFAGLDAKDFAAQAAAQIKSWSDHPDPTKPINPLIARAFAHKPPASLAEAARRYSEILNSVEIVWRFAVRLSPSLSSFSDPAMEEIRLVFDGPEAAPNAQLVEFDDLELFPDRPSQGKLQELRKAVEQWRISGAGAPPRAHALVDRAEPIQAHVFLRGNPNQLGPAVDRRMPTLFGSFASKPFSRGSGRLELARDIVDPRNPLTARVIVNRVWMHHFGQGLVRTPSDFGTRGDTPSHPELLDYLAAWFIRDGWSLKRLHRLILLSATFTQSSDLRPDLLATDPENRLLGRMNRRRLDFEAMRDALLFAGGRLDSKIGGPSAHDVLAPASTRRTLYGFIDRLQVPGLYLAYDFPSPDSTNAQRAQTTIPQQALFLMNSPFARECAKSFARQQVSNIDSNDERIRRMFLMCFAREPSTNELAAAKTYLSSTDHSAWERFAQALFSTNEFVFID